ncbi:hypothetical protein Tco_1146906 [Tanacetum coccineum]
MPKYSVKSSDKDALDDYDHKRALFQTMTESKSFNKHHVHKALYHALMESLLADKEGIDQGVVNSLKKKRQHDDQDEDPSAGPNHDPEWNTCQVVNDQPEQPWFNNMLSAAKDPLTFDELMATPIDFFKFAINRLKIEKLTKAHLVAPVYNLLKGTCQRDRCPFDLSKPLPLKGRPGHLTVASEYFFNNNLEYLKSLDPEKKYTTSITKAKDVRYELVGIEYMIPNLWSVTKVGYDKDATFRIKHWGPKRQQLYRAQHNRFSKHNVFSHQKILKGDFVNLHLNDIEDMLILVVQHKLFHLDGEVIVDLAVALRMLTRSLIIKKRVKDVQLGVESY